MKVRAAPITPAGMGPEMPLLVLFLPGLSGNNRQWELVLARLGGLPADFAYGAPILPNAAIWDTNPSIADVAQGISNALRAAHRRQVVLVSHSVGSFVALGIAREMPETVKSVVLVNGGLAGIAQFLDRPLHTLAARPADCLGFMRLFLLVSTPTSDVVKRVIANRRWFSRAVFGDLVPAAATETRATRRLLVEEAGGPHVLPSIWKNRHHWPEFQRYAHEIDTEVLIIAGDRDPVAGEPDAELMAALLPHARVRLLSGVGHAAPIEVPDAVAQAVREAVQTE